MNLNWKKRLKIVLLLILTGLLFLPVCAYLVGLFVVGPYEGQSGMAGYLGTLYVSAWRGELAARLLLLTPLLLAITWLIGLRLYRLNRAGTTADGT